MTIQMARKLILSVLDYKNVKITEIGLAKKKLAVYNSPQFQEFLAIFLCFK